MRLCQNPNCGNELIRRGNEPERRFEGRQFCSNKCARACRPVEVYEEIAKSRKNFEETEDGKKSRKLTTNGRKKWFSDNPEKFQEMVRKQSESRNANGYAEKMSNWATDFFKTDEGQKRKEKYREMYSGKIRPPIIRDNMKIGLRKYWDSPEGIKHRESISIRMTDDLSEPPYGPGWNDAAFRTRERDGQCVICGQERETRGSTDKDGKRSLSVHHIYRKRMFGYIPGQNDNYKWANNLANLVTLCSICHGKVERHVVNVPMIYQQNADLLWNEFLSGRN